MDDRRFFIAVFVGAIVLGLFMRDCEGPVPDYNCVEEVTPWGVECA